MHRLTAFIMLFVFALGFGQPASALAADTPKTALLAAMKKTGTLKVFRMSGDMTMKGNIPAGSDFGSMVGSNGEISLLSIKADISNGDSHIKASGFLMSFLGGTADRGMEMIQVDDIFYVRGPMPMLGAPENRWYKAEQGDVDRLGGAESATDPQAALKELEKADFSWVKQLGTEQLDGQKCTIYGSKDRVAVMKVLQNLAEEQTQSADLSGVRSAALQFWVCDDGYFHQGRLDLEGASPETPKDVYSFKASMRLYDFGAQIKITAPANALKLEDPRVGIQPVPGSAIAPGMVTVVNGGNIRAEPSLKGKVLGQLHATDSVTLIEKTADGRWYKISAPEATGWVNVSLLRIPPEVAAQVPVTGGQATVVSGLTATVFNGGNVRSEPSPKGKVLDQINAHERVQLLQRTQNGTWYKVTNIRNVTGWVHKSLLTIDQATAAQVPVS